MAAITGSGVWTYTIIGQLAGQTTMTVIHLRDTSTGTIEDYAGDALVLMQTQAAVGGFNEKYLACCSADFAIQEVRTQPVYPQRMRAVPYIPALTDGTIPGASLPPNSAQTVTKYTDGATRRDMGSMHIPAVPVSVVGGGLLLLGHVQLLQTLGDSLCEMWDSGNLTYSFRPILWSRVTPTTKRDITQAKAQDTVRTSRRRTVRVGI